MSSSTNASVKNTPDNDSLDGPDPRTDSQPHARQGYRFSKSQRLPDAGSYASVFAKANRSRDNLFTVLSRENGMDRARLGLAISKKHCRKAAGRNRVKRLVRESFRQHAEQLKGLDIVVLGQPGTSRADNKAIFSSLAGHWQRTRTAGTGRQRPPHETHRAQEI